MLWIALSAAAAIQFGAHYVPWGRIIGRAKLPRLGAYMIGVIGMFTPMSIYAQFATLDPLAMWGFAICAGLGTGAGYLLDWVLEMRDQAREGRQTVDLLSKRLDDCK